MQKTKPIHEQKTMANNFDAVMAQLLIESTHHSLTGCRAAVEEMVRLLHELLQHSELEHYPQQQRVLIKMHHLWRTKLFRLQQQSALH